MALIPRKRMSSDLLDPKPKKGSFNGVTSDGVFNATGEAINNILDDGSASETVVVAVPSSQSGDYTVGNYYEVQGKVARLRTKTDGDNVTQLTFDTTSGVLDAMNGIIEDIASIGSPLQWKGPATVAALNAGITGIQAGWTYTLTDAGTLTDGSVVVDVGDEVAWTENDEWFKVGGDGGVKYVTTSSTYSDIQAVIDRGQFPVMKVVAGQGYNYYYPSFEYSQFVFKCVSDDGILGLRWNGSAWVAQDTVIYGLELFYGTVAAGPSYTFPDESDVRAAVDNGKVVIIKMSGVSGDTWFQSGLKYGSQYIFCDTMRPERQLRLEDLGSGYTWSVVTLPATNSVVTFTGTLNPDASPVDYTGMPNSIDVASAIANSNEVRLVLTNGYSTPVVYRLIADMQYSKIFAAMDSNHIGNGGYVNLLIMGYAGPGNPWHWSVAKALQQALNTQDKTESDISSGHMEIASNNTVTTLTLTTVNAVTMHTSDYTLPPNFAVQIDNTGNSNDVTIDVQHGPDSLKYSVAGGNVVGAGKYMQLTCVGSCWTLAEFTVPTP